MPQVFKIGSYWAYFWSNKSDPLEPIHVHVSQGAPTANATKIWVTGSWYGELQDTACFCSVPLLPGGVGIEWLHGQDIAPHELYELSIPA